LLNFSSTEWTIFDVACYTHTFVRRQQVGTIETQLLTRGALTAIEMRKQVSVDLFVAGKSLLACFTLLKMGVGFLGQSFPVESKAYKLLVCRGY
jgi:hypothetical protein